MERRALLAKGPIIHIQVQKMALRGCQSENSEITFIRRKIMEIPLVLSGRYLSVITLTFFVASLYLYTTHLCSTDQSQINTFVFNRLTPNKTKNLMRDSLMLTIALLTSFVFHVSINRTAAVDQLRLQTNLISG